MPRDGVAGEVAAIGFVLADAEVGLFPQAGRERAAEAFVGGVEHAHVPRPGRAALKLAEEPTHFLSAVQVGIWRSTRPAPDTTCRKSSIS